MWRVNLRVLAVALSVVGFYTAVAHVIPQLESEVPSALALGADASPEALVAAGERIFNGAGGCTACHGLGTRAPNLLTDDGGHGTIGQRCDVRIAGMDCKAYLHESLTQPGKFVVPGFEPIMPDVRRQLDANQVWALVAYLQSQGGPVTVTAADLSPSAPAAPAPALRQDGLFTQTLDPALIFGQKGCVGCHLLDGTGGAVGPPLDHVGRRLSREQIRRAILEPNADTAKGYEKFAGTMPTTFGAQLSAAQLESLVVHLARHR